MYRVTARNAPKVCNSTCSPSRTMFTTTPFFPRFGHGPLGAFSNDVFRLLDSTAADLVPQSSRQPARRTFTPRFDVTEAGSSYELKGELPGFEQKDLDIEFVDERTLLVRGTLTTEETRSNTPTTADDDAQPRATAEDAATSDNNASDKSSTYHKATVEDDYVDVGPPSGAASSAPKPSSTEVAPPAETPKQVQAEPQFKYWVSERSTGHFERSFAFPGKINQDEVKASLKNGILSIVVPKIVEREARKITIQ